ncbi:MAG: peptidase, partial [Ponticaulis sp.]|nr:peptidase [Ponticaulis sp.]
MGKPIWPRASSIRVDRSLAAHTVMGLVISAILYIICVSGTLAVFEDELGWWERPSAPAVETVTPEAAQTAAENVLASDPDTTHL